MLRRWPVLVELTLLALGCGGAVTLAASLLPRVLVQRQTAHVSLKADHKLQISQNEVSGAFLGELRIPALGLKTPVLEDCTPEILRRGSCHITGTAHLGGLGTAAIAGHRDASFRVLQSAKAGTSIAIQTPGGTYFYSIDNTRIVMPEDVAVVSVRNRPGLVLITCYPFYYIGSAPKRFIVEAHLVSAAPSA